MLEAPISEQKIREFIMPRIEASENEQSDDDER
jgi:hypothetical protein